MCPAPIGSLKPPSRDWVPGLEQALPGRQVQLPQGVPASAVLASLAPTLMTGQWLETRPRTQRGLRRPLLPAEVRAPPVAGQEGGVSRGPSSSWEGAGKGRGAQRMCGSACLPGGGAASPALPLTAPPPPWTERWGYHHPGRPWEVMGRGTHSDLSRPETSNPPPSVNTAPNSGRLAGSSTPESSRLGARGFPGLGGCRVRSALPPPLFYKPDLETESWTQGSPALGGKESTAEPLTQPIPNEPRT